MKTQSEIPNTKKRRERGAALVTMMLISTLLLGAGAALLAASNIGATNSIDSTNEAQAYYAAEAGLQSALNVLRNNVVSVNGAAPARQPTFLNIVRRADGSQTNLDLSEWLEYTPGRNMVILDNSAWTRFAAFRINVVPNDFANPTSLSIRSTGFGPRGALKQLELIVNRSAFNFEAPSTITLVGDQNGNPLSTFALGNSNSRTLTGVDASGRRGSVPTLGFTQQNNRNDVETNLLLCGTSQCNKNLDAIADSPRTGVVSGGQLPSWLQTASNARAFLNELQGAAIDQKRYYSGGTLPTYVGTAADPKMTFVDGDYSLSGSGGGLLVVTGTLTLRGNFNWNGLILVLGAGRIQRDGGGDGVISGALVTASFDRNDPNGGFRAISFDTNGGGSTSIIYNSLDVLNSLTTLGIRVAGVREW